METSMIISLIYISSVKLFTALRPWNAFLCCKFPTIFESYSKIAPTFNCFQRMTPFALIDCLNQRNSCRNYNFINSVWLIQKTICSTVSQKNNFHFGLNFFLTVSIRVFGWMNCCGSVVKLMK